VFGSGIVFTALSRSDDPGWGQPVSVLVVIVMVVGSKGRLACNCDLEIIGVGWQRKGC